MVGISNQSVANHQLAGADRSYVVCENCHHLLLGISLYLYFLACNIVQSMIKAVILGI
jgi:hypothetical protein